jgi:hypothetical protein
MLMKGATPSLKICKLHHNAELLFGSIITHMWATGTNYCTVLLTLANNNNNNNSYYYFMVAVTLLPV